MMNNDTIQYLEDQIKSNPKSLAFARLAGMYLEQGRVDDAVNLLEQGIQTYPSYVTGHFILAKAYIAKNQREKAEDALKKVISHDKFYLMAHKLLGDLMARIGWENKAAQCYRDILAIDPLDEETEQMLDTFSFAVEPQAAPEITPKSKERDWISGSPPIFEKSAKVNRHTQQNQDIKTENNESYAQQNKPDITGFDIDTVMQPGEEETDSSQPVISIPDEIDLSKIDLESFSASTDSIDDKKGDGLPSGMTSAGELDLSDFDFDSAASVLPSRDEKKNNAPAPYEPVPPLHETDSEEPADSDNTLSPDTDSLEPDTTEPVIETQSFSDEEPTLPPETINEAVPLADADENKIDEEPFFTENPFPEQQETFDTGINEELPSSEAAGTISSDKNDFQSSSSDLDNLDEIAKLFGEERETKPDTDLFIEDDGIKATSDLSDLIIEEPAGMGQEKTEEPVDSAPADYQTAEPVVFSPDEDHDQTAESNDYNPGTDDTAQDFSSESDASTVEPIINKVPITDTPEQPESQEKAEKSMKIVSPTLGEIYSAQGQYKKAIIVYQKLIDKNPETEERYTQKIRELEQKLEDTE